MMDRQRIIDAAIVVSALVYGCWCLYFCLLVVGWVAALR